MEVGIGLPNAVPGTEASARGVGEARRGARLLDAGNDRPHRLRNFEPLIALTAAAAVTERIGLATVLLGPLRGSAASPSSR